MINSANNLSNTLAADVKDVSNLRLAANQNSPEALKTAAKQFEALFMNMIMKSMRDATPQEGMFESQQTKMYTSMLDQQVSQNLANRGVGLADMLIRQLSNRTTTVIGEGTNGGANSTNSEGSVPGLPINKGQAEAMLRTDAAAGTGKPSLWQPLSMKPLHDFIPVEGMQGKSLPGMKELPAESVKSSTTQAPHVKAFQDRLTQHAEAASRETGIPAKFMLGQAALESGWGKREIKAADGTPSHNLFGIKATGGWQGKVVETATTEYVNGVPETKLQKFRAYDSYADSFRDYAKMLSTNPRYEKVLNNAQDASSFAQGLQRAGYATDPHYAAKLTRIINQSLSG